ncbi:MAG: hypothetical protein LBB11_02740 [Puniceicoccales bacterium]|jgi:NADH:ubiquinone oxidoreductase subunit 5 (subunit L)/multisubunit Na+/H+ antiporter MnhA subunit|nr:hypothetical protein [Puniceicoccales bacterium]
MNSWLITIILQIIFSSIPVPKAATVSPHPLGNFDISQTLLPPLAPVETESYWKMAVLMSSLLGLSLLVLIFLWRRRRIKPKANPLSSFQQFLRDLHQAKLYINTQDTKAFCSTLCFALKSYLQREYQLPITCRTTEEFLRLFSKSSKFSWDMSSSLTYILQYSDQAKFAGQVFDHNFHRDLFLQTCHFVREVKRIRRQTPTVPQTSEKTFEK